MQLIGLLLFKHYRKEALEPYLKILCSSGLKCRSEDAFDVSKTILWKIVQRHSACFEPALSFYVVNIDVTDEKGKFFRLRWHAGSLYIPIIFVRRLSISSL